jgi:hypothetical protein
MTERSLDDAIRVKGVTLWLVSGLACGGSLAAAGRAVRGGTIDHERM